MALAHEFTYLNVQIGTVDYTGYLANQEQIATMPAGSEVGRATLAFLDSGSMPAIPMWGTVVIKAGTAAPGTPVWGGYATRQSSEPFNYSGGSARLVTVDCQSYAIALITNEPISDTYGGGNNESITADYEIVDDLVSTFLPAFYDAGSISSANPVTFDYIQFSQESLRSALNKVLERTGKEYGVTAGADFYYRPTGDLGTVVHALHETPDLDVSFPMTVKPYDDQDHVDVRNAVRVVGGWTLSTIQTEDFTTDGIAYAFQVDYFPQDIIRVTLAGIVQSVGVYLVDDPADFDCLVHYDQRKFIYQLPPETGKTLEVVYRYPVRVEEDVVDAGSVAAIGGTLWAQTIEDRSISSVAQAQLIGSAYLARSTAGIGRGQLSTSWVGTAGVYQPGQIVAVTAQALGWAANELEIQAVTARFQSRPGGVGSCLTYWDLDVGTPLTVGRSIGEAFTDSPTIKPENYAPSIRQALTEAEIPRLDHGSGLTGLDDDDHPHYLLASGARTGAASQRQNFTTGLRIGGTANYVDFDATGHQTWSGTGKPWLDQLIEPVSRATGSNSPTFEKWFDDVAGSSRGVYLYSFDDATAGSEKEIFFNIQMNHNWDGGDIFVHVHWVGAVNDVSGDDQEKAPRWGLEYCWKEPGQVFGDTTTIYATAKTPSELDIVAGKHYITEFAAIAPGSTADGISSVLIGRLVRNSSNAADTYSATGAKCGLLYIDAHYQLARVGSTDEYTA